MTAAFTLGVVVAVMLPLAGAISAITVLRMPGWRSRMPPVSMLTVIGPLHSLHAPQLHLVAMALGAWVVVLIASIARLHALCVFAIVTCAAAAALLLLREAPAATVPLNVGKLSSSSVTRCEHREAPHSCSLWHAVCRVGLSHGKAFPPAFSGDYFAASCCVHA
jgi:hypothetical protein